MKKPIIGFIGLSHLGICTLLSAASKNYTVYGFDFDSTKVEQYQKKQSKINEKNLLKYLTKYSQNIFFSSDFKILSKCDIVYISEDVKTDSRGNSNLNNANKYIKKTIKFANKKAYLVILCQVTPGFTRKINWPKKKLYYQVETLIFGNAIFRASFPERIIIGAEFSKFNINSKFGHYLKAYNCPILPMKYESAELAKISINMLLISNITIANTLAELCEKIGADWAEIVPSLKLDKRIGKNAYINTGLGLSGGNLERDLVSAIKLSKKNNLNPKFLETLFYSSEIHKNWVLNIVNKKKLNLNKDSKIAILGLSYKEGTHSIKNSPAVNLIKNISFKNIFCYDPVADLSHTSLDIVRCDNINDTIYESEILILMTNWDEFSKISKKILFSLMKGRTIIDPFGILKKLKLNNYGFKYYTKGKELKNGK